MDLKKVPSIAETVDWARAVVVLGRDSIDEDLLVSTLSLLVKEQKDLELVMASTQSLARQASR
jgi:hypothetical protein